MSIAPDRIVHYEDAPVAEVVLGVQFAGSPIDLEVLAEFSRPMREEFPHREQHEPLAESSEDFSSLPIPAAPSVQLIEDFPFPRTWFVSGDSHYLVQVQANRLLFNWRKLDTADAKYPHYSALRPRFEQSLTRLRESFEVLGRSQPTVNFAEVTYVNAAAAPGAAMSGAHPELHRLLRIVRDPQEVGLPTPQDMIFAMRQLIPAWDDDAKSPAGRLYVHAQPAYLKSEQLPIYQLRITANLVSGMSDDGEVLRALDAGRACVVETFDAIITPEMQDFWGRQEGPR